jgi:Phage protein Gp138 N-terminal domain
MVDTNYQPPSASPPDDGTLTGVIKTAMLKHAQNTDGMMPVEVVAYDRTKNRATVKHLVQMVGSDGQKVDRAQISSVRVQQPGNASFSISLPIKPGDKGWILAADRDMSLFQQDLQSGAPNTQRMHSFQDGLFMPDAMSFGTVHPDDDDRVAIQSNNGNVRVSFDESTLNLNVGGAASAVLTASGLTVTIGGVVMAITAAGVAITGGNVTHNGTNIGATHVHGGVAVGGANTAGPH